MSRHNEIKFCTKYPVEFQWIYTNPCGELWDRLLLFGGIPAVLRGLQLCYADVHMRTGVAYLT